MNRLSPLIVRRVGPLAVAAPWDERQPFDGAQPEKWLEELRLFATGWVGGLIFFATFLG